MLSSVFCTKAEKLGRNITCLSAGLSQAHLLTHTLDFIPHVSWRTLLHQLPSLSLPLSFTSSPLATSWQLTNMFKAYLFWETTKIKILFSILPTSEVISLSLTFPKQTSFLIEFTPYLSSVSSLMYSSNRVQTAWRLHQFAETLAVTITNIQAKLSSRVYSAWPVGGPSFVL